MSNTAIRFTPRTLRVQRTGMIAYQGIMAEVMAEREAQAEADARYDALMQEVDSILFDAFYTDRIASVATAKGRTDVHRTAKVQVRYVTRLAPNYSRAWFVYEI